MTKQKGTTMCVDARTAKRFKCYNLLYFLRVIFSFDIGTGIRTIIRAEKKTRLGSVFPVGDEAHKRL